MKRFTGTLSDLGAFSFLCDESGYILSRVGCAKTLLSAAFNERANCAEQAIGTNAPGLALVTREPIVVTADEHFSRRLRTACCVASPILDDELKLRGAVDITKLFDQNISEDLTQRLLKLVISVTDAMRNELSLRAITKAPRLASRTCSDGRRRPAPIGRRPSTPPSTRRAARSGTSSAARLAWQRSSGSPGPTA